jgi:carotenoid cleavage dioxygenase-like enzyme
MGPITSLWHNAFQGATFMHDFCVTQNYTVLFEGSMNIRPLRMLKGSHPLQYDGAQVARFGLIRRAAGAAAGAGAAGGEGAADADAEEVVWCDCGAAEMVYHFVNAWVGLFTSRCQVGCIDHAGCCMDHAGCHQLSRVLTAAK